MNLPFLRWRFDERFLMHRLRSTSLASMAGALVTGALFFRDLLGPHIIRWDLFSIIATMAAAKMAALAWYRFND